MRIHICSRITCGRCKTEYCPNCYSGCPQCTRTIININATTKVNTDRIKEFYKLN